MKNSSKHRRQVELAEILFESGMELPVIEKITGVAGVELLADRIDLAQSDSKYSDRKK